MEEGPGRDATLRLGFPLLREKGVVQQLPFLRWPGGQKPFRSHLLEGRATDPYAE